MTVEVPEFGGCPWPVDPACFGNEWESLDDGLRERSIALASATLQRLTAYRVSNCPVTIRPCAPRCGEGLAYQAFSQPAFVPVNYGGTWVNGCGHLDCACETFCEVRLPAPVGRVDEVRVDGAIVDPAEYRVVGNRLIYTGPGECKWPATQNLRLDDTETGTFSVTYLNAHPVDSNGAWAAGILAYEFAKACVGRGDKCRLPVGVTSIVRQGITMEIASGIFPDGLTGIREVDAYIGLWNPNGRTHPTTVWTPQMRRS